MPSGPRSRRCGKSNERSMIWPSFCHAPALTVKTVSGEIWTLSELNPESFVLVVSYRGLHCLICRGYRPRRNLCHSADRDCRPAQRHQGAGLRRLRYPVRRILGHGAVRAAFPRQRQSACENLARQAAAVQPPAPRRSPRFQANSGPRGTASSNGTMSGPKVELK